MAMKTKDDVIKEIVPLFQIGKFENELAELIYSDVFNSQHLLRWNEMDKEYYWDPVPNADEIYATIHRAVMAYCRQPIFPNKKESPNYFIFNKLHILTFYLGDGIAVWERGSFLAIKEDIQKYPNVSRDVAFAYIKLYNLCFQYTNQSVNRKIYLDISNPLIQILYSQMLKDFDYFTYLYMLHIKVIASIIYLYLKNINPTIGPDEELMLKRIPKLYRHFKRYIIGKSMEELWRQSDVDRGRVYLSDDFFIDL